MKAKVGYLGEQIKNADVFLKRRDFVIGIFSPSW